MKKFIDKYGRKFSFALYVMFFVYFGIFLNTALLCFQKIGEGTYEKLFLFCGGFITLLASTYFFANSNAKKYYNEDLEKTKKELQSKGIIVNGK